MNKSYIKSLIEKIDDQDISDLPQLLYIESQNEIRKSNEDAKFNSDVLAYIALRIEREINQNLNSEKAKALKLKEVYDSISDKINEHKKTFNTGLTSIKSYFYWFNKSIILCSASQRSHVFRPDKVNNIKEILNSIDKIQEYSDIDINELDRLSELMSKQIEELSKLQYEPHVSDKKNSRTGWKVKRGQFYEFAVQLNQSKNITIIIDSLKPTHHSINELYSALESNNYEDALLRYQETQSELKEFCKDYIQTHIRMSHVNSDQTTT